MMGPAYSKLRCYLRALLTPEVGALFKLQYTSSNFSQMRQMSQSPALGPAQRSAHLVPSRHHLCPMHAGSCAEGHVG